MLPVEIVPGLFRWSAPHPEWSPGVAATDNAYWDQEVGCVLYEVGGVLALFDPLLPSEGREAFLGWLDERVAGRPVSVLTTIRWHRRDRGVIAERYSPNTTRVWNLIPSGVEPHVLRGAGEIVYWLEGAATLVPGDRLLGDGHGGLRLPPESWLESERVDRRGLAALLEPLLELPIERVLASHGEPVLHDGRAALARALEAARNA